MLIIGQGFMELQNMEHLKDYLLEAEENEDNNDHDIITYWDEPTITLDYETHECHSIIQKNWKDKQFNGLLKKETFLEDLLISLLKN